MIVATVFALVEWAPIVSTWDARVSEWVQRHRSLTLDRVMLVVTLSADYVVAAAIIMTLVAYLLFRQRWWLAIHMTCVSVSATLSVTIVKVLVSRARPENTAGVLNHFSFPSGHACTGAVVAGLVAVMLGYRRSSVSRYGIYAIATLIALLIGFSRVYLLAHWPTDVIAGLAFGYALVVAFAWQLHTGYVLPVKGLWPLIASICLTSVIGYAIYTFDEQLVKYAING